MPVSYLLYNGKLYPSDTLLISPENRSFRYGDGFFETMKMINGNVILKELHMERLFASLELMQFDKPEYFTPAYMLQQIRAIAGKNGHEQLARIRLTVFRGNGNLYDEDNQPNYLIQSWRIDELPAYNNKGLITAIYKDVRKTADAFSSVKSNNYLPYLMAARWCKKVQVEDALVMNCFSRIAEATTANVFIVKNNIVQTPALSEGCINGVVRRYLLAHMKQHNIVCEEKPIAPETIMDADELFLTNAGFYIRWVQQCGEKKYKNTVSKQLFNEAIVPLVRTK